MGTDQLTDFVDHDVCVCCVWRLVLKGAWDLCKGKAQRKKERRKKSLEVKKINLFILVKKKGLGPGLASHILRKRQSGKEGRKAPPIFFLVFTWVTWRM